MHYLALEKKENIVVNAIVEENNNNLGNNIENNNNIVDENNVEIIIGNNNNENDQSNFLDEAENEKYVSEFIKKFLKDRIVTIDDKTYIRDKDKLRLVIDDYLEKIKIIGMAHRIGHEGLKKTYDRIKKNYYWKNMILDIKKYIYLFVKYVNLIDRSPF